LLFIVGAGLGPQHVTDLAKSLIKRAEVVIVEAYTSPNSDWLEDLAKALNKATVKATRDMLEENVNKLIDMARYRDVVVLVAGDPLIATTHSSVVVEALTRGVKVKVIPSVSGPCAAMSLSGLQFYRFGRKVTVPGPWRGADVTPVAYWLLGNLCLDLHSLILLDVDQEGRQLPPADGTRELLKAFNELLSDQKENLGDLLVLAVSATDNDVYVTYSRLSEPEALRPITPSTMIVPASLHPVEQEFLKLVHGVPSGLIDLHLKLLRRIDPCNLYFSARHKVMASP